MHIICIYMYVYIYVYIYITYIKGHNANIQRQRHVL